MQSILTVTNKISADYGLGSFGKPLNVENLINKGNVRINGITAQIGDVVFPGDVVTFPTKTININGRNRPITQIMC